LEVETHEAPRRGRPPRAQAVAGQRRRRNAGSLNRMMQYRLDCIPLECLDKENYVYRWIDDRPGRLRMATKMDDYDFVTTGDLGDGFNPEATDSESTERVRMFAEADRAGNPTYTYLCRKPKDFWQEDNEDIVQRREAMMEGRVYHGAADGAPSGEGAPAGSDLDEGVSYVPAGVKMGGSALRRRAPTNFK